MSSLSYSMNEVLFMYSNTTNRVKISDLSFCEVAVEKNEIVGGGQLFGLGLLKGFITNPLLTGDIASFLNRFTLTKSYVDPTGNVIQQYEDPSTNRTATVIQNADGTNQRQSIILTQNDATTTSSSVIATSTTS